VGPILWPYSVAESGGFGGHFAPGKRQFVWNGLLCLLGADPNRISHSIPICQPFSGQPVDRVVESRVDWGDFVFTRSGPGKHRHS